MTISHLLEDYGAYATAAPVSLTDVSLEEQRLEAFEKGYQAGWDDSVKAQSDDVKRVSTDLAQNLHELSFTYQEAYAAIMKSLTPLLRQMVETVLPHAAHQTLGVRLAEMISELASKHGNQPVEIVSATENVAAVEQMVSSDLPMKVTVTEETSLADGQVYIRIGETEREIDLSEVLAEIGRSVSGFIEENQKDIA